MIPIYVIRRGQKGFTIVEVMVAIAVFAFAILGIFSMQTGSVGSNMAARIRTEATQLTAQQIETLMSLDTAHDWLSDPDGDGNKPDKDKDNNGIDDDDEAAAIGGEDGINNFGLDDTFDGSGNIIADRNQTAGDDGEYIVLWNVATDKPVPNINTIRVFVFRRTANLDIDSVPAASIDYFWPKQF